MSLITSPKSLIISLTEPLSEKFQGRVKPAAIEDKLKIISQILKDNPILKGDPVVMQRLFAFTDTSRSKEVEVFRRELMLETCNAIEKNILMFHEAMPEREKGHIIRSYLLDKGRFDFSKGILHFTENALKKVGDIALWNFIKKHPVKTLIVDSFIYNENQLKQLIKKKPSVEDLTQNYTLKFFPGDELIVPKATLLLCGAFFESLFTSTLKESQEKSIDFSLSNVSLNVFYAILQEVETGKSDPEISPEVYEAACEYLQFSGVRVDVPEGAFGPKEWEYHYGIKVSYVPPVPKELIEELNKPCPFFKEKPVKRVLVLIPKDMTLNTMIDLAINPLHGHKTEKGYSYYWDKIEKKYGNVPVEKSYWVLKIGGLIPGSRGKTRDEQLSLAKAIQGYQAPSLIEESISSLVTYVKTGVALLSKDEAGNWIWTCCREEKIDTYKLVVGGFSPAGLCVIFHYDDDDDVGVAPVFRK